MKKLLLSLGIVVTVFAATWSARASAESAADSGGEAIGAQLLKPDYPVEWQKIAIDELIRTRIKRALAQNLPEQYFAVTVSTTLRPVPPKANAANANNPTGTNAAGDGPAVGKLNLDLSLLIAAQRAPGAVDPTDTTPTALKLITGVDVAVLLDNRVPKERTTVVRDIVQGTVRSVTPVTATINVTSAPLYTPPDKLAEADLDAARAKKAALESSAPSETPWSLQQWISELKYVVVLFLAVIAAMLGHQFSLRGARKIEERRVALLEAQDARDEQSQERVRQTAGLSGGSTGDAQTDESARKMLDAFEKGVERFKMVLTASPDRAAQLVRQWIRNPKHGASEALTLLPQAIPLKELNTLFDRLGREERKEWRQFLALPYDQASVRKADGFIASQIVDAFLSPAPKMDEATRRELNELSLGDCVELVRENTIYGAVLAAVLPPGQVGRIFTILPPEMSSQITSESVRLSEEQLAEAGAQLKRRVLELKAQKKTVRFLEHASELMSDIGPEREGAIFSALTESGEFRLLEAAARQLFPAELLTRLPPAILKNCLDVLSVERRAEVICSRDPKERELLMAVYGAEGSRMRDLLNLEIQRIEGDEVRRKRIERQRNSLWKELADQARLQIRRDDAAREVADGLLGAWLYERSNGSVGAPSEDARASA